MSYMTFLIQFIRNVGSSPGQCVHISTQTNANQRKTIFLSAPDVKPALICVYKSCLKYKFTLDLNLP